MQSRLATTATKSYWVLSVSQNQALRRGVAYIPTRRVADPAIYTRDSEVVPAPIPTGLVADPAIYTRDSEVAPAVPSGDPEGTENVAMPKPAKKETEHKPLEPPHASAPRLESIGVYNPSEPNYTQQKPNTTIASLQEVSCAGHDGTPWPRDKEEEELDDREYYKHHKASPLSEIKVADTRKPITRVMHGTADAEEYEAGIDVIGWRPEQLDTAEEALERAVRIWKQSAMNGDPDSPHGRVLRALRGEL